MYEENVALIWLFLIMLFIIYALTHEEQTEYEYDVVVAEPMPYFCAEA